MHLLSRCYCICRRLISANICKFTLTVCNPSLARDDDPARPNWQQQEAGGEEEAEGKRHASGISDNCRRVALNEQRLLLWQLLLLLLPLLLLLQWPACHSVRQRGQQ